MAQYVAAETLTRDGRGSSSPLEGQGQEDMPRSLRHRSAYYLERGTKMQDAQVSGRSIATVYVPTLQERAQAVMEGRVGFCWEVVNFTVSLAVFAAYVAELYDKHLGRWNGHREVEIVATAFFVADFAMQLFVASEPTQYLTSRYGVIDFLTVIPSLVIWIVPGSHSRVVFVLRVLRVFRALRVLRLTEYIRFKKHGFEYELGVFVLSAVAVIFCAAGIFQELEAGQYLDDNPLEFHNSFYFILVTISTIGYGDITPRTTLGHFFVIIMIVSVFTTVPRQATKLNELAKRNYSWDKDYSPRTKSSGHVIVSAKHISLESAVDFLQEFYHPSRGVIGLIVVFLGEERPPKALTRTLASEKYRHKACYLRGSLLNVVDQQRVKLSIATAVFLLNSKCDWRGSPFQDAATLLQMLAVRRCAENYGQHIDIYTQVYSHEFAVEGSPFLLAASANDAFSLKTLMLSRAVVCPGSTTLISNLLRSVQAREFRKLAIQQTPWFHEYVDGMSHQVFPLIFSTQFDFERYEDVARHVFEKYGALLISILSKRGYQAGRPQTSPPIGSKPGIQLAPFGTSIRQGDIGFVIAKTAADVLRIVDTYGYWGSNDAEDGRHYSFSSSTAAVRVSSENLLRRHSSQSRFQQADRNSAVRDLRPVELPTHSKLPCDGNLKKEATASRERGMNGPNKLHIGDGAPSDPANTQLQDAVRLRDFQLLERIFDRDHYRMQMPKLSNHYVVCGGSLMETLAIVSLVKNASLPNKLLEQDSEIISPSARCVILTPKKPNSSQLMAILEDDEQKASLLDGVFFVEGSSTRSRDLQCVGALKATKVLFLPQDAPFGGTPSGDDRQTEDENVADFAVIRSLLAMEIVKHNNAEHGSLQQAVHRPQSSSRLGSGVSLTSPTEESSRYQREIELGLPIDSVRLRALERLPDLDPTVFNQESDVIEETLKRYGSQRFEDPEADGFLYHSTSPGNTVAVLELGSSVKFCGPVGHTFEDARNAFLSPAFAAGRLFVCSALDRIVCQSFFNPYIVDIIKALAGTNTTARSDQRHVIGQESTSSKMRSDETSKSTAKHTSRSSERQLCSVRVQETHVGASFGEAFASLLSSEVLVVGIFRQPNPELGNALPFVYTCPCASTILHANDLLFVLR